MKASKRIRYERGTAEYRAELEQLKRDIAKSIAESIAYQLINDDKIQFTIDDDDHFNCIEGEVIVTLKKPK